VPLSASIQAGASGSASARGEGSSGTGGAAAAVAGAALADCAGPALALRATGAAIIAARPSKVHVAAIVRARRARSPTRDIGLSSGVDALAPAESRSRVVLAPSSEMERGT
jgi:hypothetical protein